MIRILGSLMVTGTLVGCTVSFELPDAGFEAGSDGGLDAASGCGAFHSDPEACSAAGCAHHACGRLGDGLCARTDVEGCAICPGQPEYNCCAVAGGECRRDWGCAWHSCGNDGAGSCELLSRETCEVCPDGPAECLACLGVTDSVACAGDRNCRWNDCSDGGTCSAVGADVCEVCPTAPGCADAGVM